MLTNEINKLINKSIEWLTIKWIKKDKWITVKWIDIIINEFLLSESIKNDWIVIKLINIWITFKWINKTINE